MDGGVVGMYSWVTVWLVISWLGGPYLSLKRVPQIAISKIHTNLRWFLAHHQTHTSHDTRTHTSASRQQSTSTPSTSSGYSLGRFLRVGAGNDQIG